MTFGFFNKTMTMSPNIDIYITHNLYLLQKKRGKCIFIDNQHASRFI